MIQKHLNLSSLKKLLKLSRKCDISCKLRREEPLLKARTIPCIANKSIKNLKF